MDYTLMHKDIPVVDMEIPADVGRIVRLSNLQTPNHLPLRINTKFGMNLKAINAWWIGRSIPATRDGLKAALETLHISDTSMLLEKCYGLSLSDQYWICPKYSGLKWREINFFHNNFSKDIGEILFGHKTDPARINLMSPDNTSDGWLQKKWIIVNGKRVLMKGSSGVYQQEPFNEVIASTIMQLLDISHIEYTLTFDNGKPYSLCENFITSDTELIPAEHIKETVKKDNRDSDYTHLLRCCDALNISDVRTKLDKMLVLDYVISNEDRHYNNFGFIRNATTLKWSGLAPVFDSGTSLWNNTPHVGSTLECKPFRKSHVEQIKLVEDLSWFNIDKLDGVYDKIIETLAKSSRVDQNRRTHIASAVMERCKQIEKLQKK